MLRLAVATRVETFERMADPLAERGIEVVHVPTEERSVALTDPGTEFAGFDAGFVYPSRIMEGGAIDALLSVPWVNDGETILTSRNKAGVIAALSEAGVSVPETVLVSNPVDESVLVDAFERVGPPVVVKPNSTTRGTGVARADDLDSFLGIADYLGLLHQYPATGDRSFLVQEFLPGARDYRAMCIDGAYAGAVERRLPDDVRGDADDARGNDARGDDALGAGRWKHNVHRGAEARGVSLGEDHRALAERAAEVLGIPWLGVDLLVNDERAVVSETNARPTIDAETKYEDGFYDDLAGLIERTA